MTQRPTVLVETWSCSATCWGERNVGSLGVGLVTSDSPTLGRSVGTPGSAAGDPLVDFGRDEAHGPGRQLDRLGEVSAGTCGVDRTATESGPLDHGREPFDGDGLDVVGH